MPTEEFRAIPGHPGYEVSNLGRVQTSPLYDSAKRLAIPQAAVATSLSGGTKHKVRYLEVSLRRVGVRVRDRRKVHHLVAETFIGPRPAGLVICHNDGNPHNNAVENLRYDTQAENIKDSYAHHGGHPESRKTECINGHDITDPNNTYANSVGRKCKRCQRARARARHHGIEDYRTLL